MLVAAPGYGKTTLAEQWAAQGRRVAWIRARRSSADVAVLARQMAAAGAEILPGCDRRLSERLNATTDPAEELDVLVDLLSEDLAGWPDDAWIAVDDYQYIGESATAEAFVEGIIQQSPVQVLISTRDRPSWVSTRSVLYGDVLEIGQSMLAMSEEEVEDMLAGARDGMSSGLLALAGGWPAVIGLASLTTTESPLPDEGLELPEQLYEFFADEVYRGLEPNVRIGLGLLATAPSLDRELAAELLGPERAERVCAEALTLGVLEERGGKLELHPLAAAFLEERARREATTDIEQTVARCLAAYRRRFEWDAAFDLVGRYGTGRDLEALFADALGALLNAARLATVETWIERAEARQLSSSTIEVAKAEIALRDGKHMSAQAFAEAALAMAGDQLSEACRAAMVAGRAAHAGSREESALGFYRLAEEVAGSPRSRRDALWGQLMCASALELGEAHELLELLESSASQSDPYELVRMADKKLGMDFRFGAIRHLGNARRVAELVGHIADPFVRCSFRCAFSCALNLSALYEEAYGQAVQLLEDANEFRVDPALPYAHSMLATALAGIGRHQQAHLALDDAVRESRRCNDEFGIQSVYASRVRILVQEGRAKEACTMEPPDLEVSLKSMRGEVLASRGLALASLGRLGEAQALCAEAIETTTGVETRVLAAAIDAVCAVNGRASGMMDSIERLVHTAFDAGAVDLVVSAYRGNPDLLAALLSSAIARERTMYIVARAGDESLVNAIGRETVSSADPVVTLSRREREVYELVCAGLSNGAIAKRLFITEGTVKVHVHHVFDKLGIRSRTALAMNAARDRWRQAASTAISEDDSSGATPSSPPPSRSTSST
jgi:ATP/maltotriose-dependent transcriptional regulator MalT